MMKGEKTNDGKEDEHGSMVLGEERRSEEEVFVELRKENFDLKLKIYYLRERLKNSSLHVNEEDLQEENMQQKILIDEKDKEISERNKLLVRATQAIDTLRKQMKEEQRKAYEAEKRQNAMSEKMVDQKSLVEDLERAKEKLSNQDKIAAELKRSKEKQVHLRRKVESMRKKMHDNAKEYRGERNEAEKNRAEESQCLRTICEKIRRNLGKYAPTKKRTNGLKKDRTGTREELESLLDRIKGVVKSLRSQEEVTASIAVLRDSIEDTVGSITSRLGSTESRFREIEKNVSRIQDRRGEAEASATVRGGVDTSTSNDARYAREVRRLRAGLNEKRVELSELRDERDAALAKCRRVTENNRLLILEIKERGVDLRDDNTMIRKAQEKIQTLQRQLRDLAIRKDRIFSTSNKVANTETPLSSLHRKRDNKSARRSTSSKSRENVNTSRTSASTSTTLGSVSPLKGARMFPRSPWHSCVLSVDSSMASEKRASKRPVSRKSPLNEMEMNSRMFDEVHSSMLSNLNGISTKLRFGASLLGAEKGPLV
eukprot:g2044.t1